MNRILIIFLILFGLISANKHNISLGMWDDKTGFSIMGYSYNFKQNEMNEQFVGGGTAILAFTGTIGWKHYYKKSKFSLYSILSEQAVAHLGFTGYMTSLSASSEYTLNSFAKIKFGMCSFFLIRTDQCCNGFGAFPFLGLEFKF